MDLSKLVKKELDALAALVAAQGKVIDVLRNAVLQHEKQFERFTAFVEAVTKTLDAHGTQTELNESIASEIKALQEAISYTQTRLRALEASAANAKQ